jgi:hypothetical protein
MAQQPHWAKASCLSKIRDHTQLRQATLTTDRHPCPRGTRTHNPSKRAAADLRIRPRCHWGGHCRYIKKVGINSYLLIANWTEDMCYKLGHVSIMEAVPIKGLLIFTFGVN